MKLWIIVFLLLAVSSFVFAQNAGIITQGQHGTNMIMQNSPGGVQTAGDVNTTPMQDFRTSNFIMLQGVGAIISCRKHGEGKQQCDYDSTRIDMKPMVKP